ncbi:hypothetical protein Ana3638_18505 [Anaerocolumna sedimenticola]|uniref:Uncharacterized protein n=1 Tax=Anaerocolumna sedimenticola TaxID=2696063 RepID=A0A6P1TRI8_9FIRM|nr:hypothetical protein [Anaerocolumna sedimenticola]QHQ62531.1 hypothetical protein Ana3638_18505 [Anaerocolumna sedimenticola]
MAVCKLCKTNIPDDGNEYCEKCFDNERAKLDESYLDNLLKSVTNSQISKRTLRSEKLTPDINSDFANTSSYNTLSINEKVLFNRNITQNITKQDEKNLRDEDKENELNTITDDDILSLLQDSNVDTDSEKQSDNDNENSYYDEKDSSEMEDTDEDLLALLDMISAQDEANNNKAEELYKSVHEPEETVSVSEESPYPDVEDFLSIDDLPEEITDNFLEESDTNEGKPNTANDMGGIFSDVLSAVDSLQDKDEIKLNNSNPSVPEADNKNNKMETKEKRKVSGRKYLVKKKIKKEI